MTRAAAFNRRRGSSVVVFYDAASTALQYSSVFHDLTVCCGSGCSGALPLSVRGRRWLHLQTPGVDQRDGGVQAERGQVLTDGKRNNLQNVEHSVKLPFSRR